jgi:hypothetical protein
LRFLEAVFPPKEFYLMEKRFTLLKLIFTQQEQPECLTTERTGRRGGTVFASTTVVRKSAGRFDPRSLFRDDIYIAFIVVLKEYSLQEWVSSNFDVITSLVSL